MTVQSPLTSLRTYDVTHSRFVMHFKKEKFKKKKINFFIVLCPHKDKLVLHCFNDILIDFMSKNEILSCKNLRNENF